MIDERQRVLIGLLSDGQFYNSSQLGVRLGISKAAISNRVSRLKSIGLNVDSVKGKGYRLRAPVELLDECVVREALGSSCLSKIGILSVVDVTASTNDDALKARVDSGYGVYLSEYQTGGRGRRGRSWVQGFASGLVMSIVKDFELDLKKLSTMSLWAAVAVCEALSEYYSGKFKIKWPNDIYVDGKKLAGILLEAKTEVGSQVRLVVGVGVNYVQQHIEGGEIDQPWIALSQVTTKKRLSRNLLTAAVVERVVFHLDRAASVGFESDLADYWAKYDFLAGKEVAVSSVGSLMEGQYEGLDSSGNLLLRYKGEQLVVNAGEVSVRSVEN